MKESVNTVGFRSTLLAAVAVNIMVGVPQLAHAQEETGAEDESPRQLNTIVVTARNRAESIQDVPLAITALSEEALDAKSIANLEDVARFTSGFSFENFSGGFASPVIRGQAQTRVTALESNVSTFLDGIYIPRSWAVDVGTASMSRIEVVKGPQSARYGRNAFAGAINYVPAKAELGLDKPTGTASTTLGDNERFDYGLNGVIPLGDRFAIGGSYMASEFDGTWENAHPYSDLDFARGTSGNAGGWDNSSVSFSAIAEPVDGWVIEGAYYNFEIAREMTANTQYQEAAGQLNCGSVRRFGSPSLFCGEIPGLSGDLSIDPRSYSVQSDTDIFRFQTAYDLTDELTVSYLYGKIEGEVDIANLTVTETANCSFCTFQNAPIGGIDYDTHEVKLAYEGNSFRGAVGAFSSEGTDEYKFEFVLLGPLTDTNQFSLADDPTAFRLALQDAVTLTEVESVFAEGQYTLPNGVTRIGAEARYSETELISIDNRRGGTLSDTFSVITPRFTLEHDLSDSTLIYASAARGAKAGGFNPTAVADEFKVFDEEFNWTYELGAKNTLLDGRLILNGAVFFTDWTDVQINSTDPSSDDPNSVTITQNLGDATVIGIEGDFAFVATDNLSFDGTFSHTQAEYSDGTIDARFRRTPASCDDIVCASSGDVGGNEIERTPPTQASFGAQWEDEIPAWNATWNIRSDVTWQSDFYATSANLGTIPARTLLSLRGSVQWDNLDVSLWMKNATDEEYVTNAFVVVLPFGNSYQTFLGPKRSYGLTAKYRF